jgi:hypothetical protein
VDNGGASRAGESFSILGSKQMIDNAKSETASENQNAAVNEPRYNEVEAAKKLGFKCRLTLWRWRRRGLIGFYKVGNRVLYGESHLNDFLLRCQRNAKKAREAA